MLLKPEGEALFPRHLYNPKEIEMYIKTVPPAKKMTSAIMTAMTAALAAYGLLPNWTSFGMLFRIPSGKNRKILARSLKVEKGEKKKVLTKVLYLSPWKEAGIQMCPWATKGCAASCLGHSTGHLQLPANKATRILKTLMFAFFPHRFLTALVREIVNHAKNAKRRDMTAAVRLNGSSDILWEKYIDMDALNRDYGVIFYDYTKASTRRLSESFPQSYHLTFSVSENPFSLRQAKRWLEAGYSVAVVIAGQGSSLNEAKALQDSFLYRGTYPMDNKEFPVIDGDETDIRFRDEAGAVVLLHAKGKALHDTSGFVQRH